MSRQPAVVSEGASIRTISTAADESLRGSGPEFVHSLGWQRRPEFVIVHALIGPTMTLPSVGFGLLGISADGSRMAGFLLLVDPATENMVNAWRWQRRHAASFHWNDIETDGESIWGDGECFVTRLSMASGP